jgi:hypothetical protein
MAVEIGQRLMTSFQFLREICIKYRDGMVEMELECRELGKCEEIAIPASVRVIGRDCFKSLYCRERLEMLIIVIEAGSSLKEIKDSAFNIGPCSLHITIAPSVIKIGNFAFGGFWGRHFGLTLQVVTVVTLGSSLLELGEGAFSHSVITSIVIPKEVRVISRECFSKCESLKEVIFEEGTLVHTFGYASFSQTDLRWFTIPRGVQVIGEGCFENTKIARITIPNGVNLIPRPKALLRCQCAAFCMRIVQLQNRNEQTSSKNRSLMFRMGVLGKISRMPSNIVPTMKSRSIQP